MIFFAFQTSIFSIRVASAGITKRNQYLCVCVDACTNGSGQGPDLCRRGWTYVAGVIVGGGFLERDFANDVLRRDRTELVNRPETGLSMVIGNVVALRKIIDEGAAGHIFSKDFAKKLGEMCDKFDVSHMNRMINVQDYPEVERSSAEVDKACKQALKMGKHIVEEWPWFAECLGRFAG